MRSEAYKARNRERQRRMRAENLELYRERDRMRYLRDGEKKRAREKKMRGPRMAQRRALYASSPEVRARAAEQKRQQRAKNPEHYRTKGLEYSKTRRARIKGAPVVEIITRAQLEELKRKQANLCFYCHDEMSPATIDHIQPLTRGGSHVMGNIALACADCNRRKRNMDPFDFLAKMGAA